MNISIQLLHSQLYDFEVWSYLYFLFLLFEILTLFMHCFPDLSEHIYEFYFEFYVWINQLSPARGVGF